MDILQSWKRLQLSRYFLKAIECYEKSLFISRELNDHDGERRLYCTLGNIYYSFGDFTKATECYKKSFYIARKGDFSKAIEDCGKYLDIVKDVGGHSVKAEDGRNNNTLGNIYCHIYC